MEDVKLNITSHRYYDHLKKMLHEMMTSSHFSDVTLVCEGRKKIRAHRSILCASSPVFRDLLETEHISNQPPIIYLRGVQFSEMEAILQFIYQGETVFHKEKINELLSVARNFEIEDLTESTMETDDLNSNIMENTENVEVSGEEHDKDNIEEFEDQFQEDYIEVEDQEDNIEGGDQEGDIEAEDQGDDIEVADQGDEVEEFEYPDQKGELDEPESFKNIVINRLKIEPGDSNIEVEECPTTTAASDLQNEERQRLMTREGSNFLCSLCEDIFKSYNGLKTHIKTKHEKVKYACNVCDYKATQPSNLKRHVQKQHGSPVETKDERVKYVCSVCGYQATQSNNLKRHVLQKQHGSPVKTKDEKGKHVCSVCGYQATQSNNLKRHIQRRHG